MSKLCESVGDVGIVGFGDKDDNIARLDGEPAWWRKLVSSPQNRDDQSSRREIDILHLMLVE